MIRALSGFFTVRTAVGDITSTIPGRLKKERRDTDIVAVGDRVTITQQKDGSGIIEAVAERTSALSRARPVARGRSLSADREQVLVANPDQLVFVFSVQNPAPNLRKLDRFLVVAEMNELTAVICANKTDLTGLSHAQTLFQRYADIGYRVIYTSVKTGEGIAELRDCLQGKLSVLTGSSGVGKSSLLNAIQQGLGLRVREVSEATGKGMHTTRHAELFALDGGGYVADTPGIRGLALFDLEYTEVDAYFREIAPLVAQCQFSDCTHKHEPGCAVRTAVLHGQIHPDRYESYLRLREEHEKLDEALY
ncbi:MAG: ribosome small subunit-dependent GTPase A [Ardenticatenaceae bacterium]|nr:ribosome small subunit-dependent GTPase A [Ardenticatenaceae bacterium]MCB9004824.1 ribosome small subunit-dependent GTPase A [Ardenticatenaceae bacterium]